MHSSNPIDMPCSSETNDEKRPDRGDVSEVVTIASDGRSVVIRGASSTLRQKLATAHSRRRPSPSALS